MSISTNQKVYPSRAVDNGQNAADELVVANQALAFQNEETMRLDDQVVSQGKRLARMPFWCAAIVGLISVLVLAGWAFEIDLLKSVVPGFVFMNPATAVAFIISSAALWLLPSENGFRMRVARVCAAAVLFTGLARLFAIFGFFDIGIDQVLFGERLLDHLNGKPNSMAPNTAFNFLLMGGALLLFSVQRKDARSLVAQALTMIVILSSFVALVGYIYGAKSFYLVVSYIPMAVHSAVSFLLLAVGLLLSKARHGLLKEILSPHIGGQTARRLLPLVVFIPVILGWMRLFGERNGVYPTEMGTAVLIVAIAIVLGAIVLVSAGLINNEAVKLNQVNLDLENQVAEQKRVERDLAVSETLLTQFVVHAPAAVAMLDTELRYLQVSERWLEDYNLLGQDIIGKSHYEVFPDVPERWKAIHQRCLAGAVEACDEDPFPREDGTIDWLQWEVQPWRKANEEVGGIIFFTQVITERKRVEQALSESTKRERAMIDNALDVICTVDAEGRFVSINPACFEIWGYQPEELIGQRYMDYVVPSDVSRTSSIDRDIQSGTDATDFENQYIHKDGSIVDVRWTSYWSEAEQLIFAVAHDITDRKLMEIELERTRDVALESARLKSEFLANMSHEIRTPMNGVLGMTELLLETELSDKQREFTQTVASSADSLLHIIDEILDFSKIEAGQMRFETIDFDLREAVEVTVEMFAGRSQAKGIEIASLIDSEVSNSLRGDPGRLQQILTNLIGNAIKFTEHGEIFVNATQTSETPTHAIVRFEIRDTGIGISEAAQKNLFRPFVQADGSTTRKYGGTGLGLAISKQMVELMGGEISVASKLGEGSAFSFTIRFEKQKAALVPLMPAPSIGLEGLRVLIVDDRETNRTILRHHALAWGMTANEVDSGADALEMLRRSPRAFDIAMLDLMMPEMDGLELARRIKAIPDLSHLKLILISSFGSIGHGETAREIGIEDYLQRPLRQSQIYNSLLNVVNDSSRAAHRPERMISSVQLSPVTGNADGLAVSNLRILVAEDNEINMEVARNQLRVLGYTADFVRNGQEAVEAATGNRYDIILMDCQMPEKDGFEATAEIRAFEGDDRHTTIVAITANALKGDREKCLAAGMDDYLGKPVKIAALRRLLEEWTPERGVDADWPDELSVESKDVVVDRTVLADYEELQQQGAPDIVVKLIDMFLDRSWANIVCLKRAADAGDMAEVARQAHAIKGSSGNIGARQMAELSASFARAVQPADARALALKLETAFEETGEILNSIKEQRRRGETQS